MTENRMPKIRVSEITAFAVFAITCGFFTALVFTTLLIMARNLRFFRFIMPECFYDENGEPRGCIEKALPTIIVGMASVLFILFGYVIGGIALGAAAVVDLMESRVSFGDFVKGLFRRRT